MGKPSRFDNMRIKKQSIAADILNSSSNVLQSSDLKMVFNLKRDQWGLAKITRYVDFLDFLIQNKIVDTIDLLDKNGVPQSRYAVGDYTDYDIALSLDRAAFLSHYTAVYVHGLTDNAPKSIYINREQSLASSPQNRDSLTQSGIDNAFRRSVRTTNNIFLFNNTQVIFLKGRNTGDLGVVKIIYNGKEYPISGIERTLIDIVIRPNYAGGVTEVLNAFSMAKDRFSVNRLSAMLSKMELVYPYHQSIGFYLQHAGYKDSLLSLFRDRPMSFDFYLSHNMSNPKFDSNWRVYYPQGLI